MRREDSCWPDPYDPEHLFTGCILIHGPLPPKGWSVTRQPNGEAYYIVARGNEAMAFHIAVIQFFTDEVAKRYSIRKWSTGHHLNLGRRWKNQFYLWLWKTIDESRNQ